MKSERLVNRAAIALFVLLFSAGLTSVAQDVSNAAAPLANSEPEASPRKFLASAEVAYSTETYPDNVVTPESSLDYVLLTSYQIHTNYKLGLRLEASQDQKVKSNSQITLARLSLSRTALKLNSYFSLIPSLRVALPVREVDIYDSSLRAAVSAAAGLAVNMAELGADTWAIDLSFTAGKNIHDFETNIHGVSNVSESYSAGLSVQKQLGRFAVTVVAGYLYGQPYLGEARQQFELTEELSYELSETWSMALGHTNAGNVFAGDGETNLVKLADANTSMTYVSAGLEF